MTSDSSTKDVVTPDDFEREVVARSATQPVVVDFWAPWCGPCRVLTPALEREVQALGGKVALVKVNVDESPELAEAFQVSSIPAVKAFVGGKLRSAFEGARDVAFVRKWLSDLVPSAGREALERALAARKRGEDVEAELAPLIDDPEVGSPAAAELASLRVHGGRAAEAAPLLPKIDPRSDEADRVPSLEALIELAKRSPAAASGDWPKALEELYQKVEDRAPDREQALADMRAIFELLGSDNELARDMRRRLQIVT